MRDFYMVPTILKFHYTKSFAFHNLNLICASIDPPIKKKRIHTMGKVLLTDWSKKDIFALEKLLRILFVCELSGQIKWNFRRLFEGWEDGACFSNNLVKKIRIWYLILDAIILFRKFLISSPFLSIHYTFPVMKNRGMKYHFSSIHTTLKIPL